MSFITDFPHTRTYDSDLGFLIEEFNQLLIQYKDLINIYEKIENDILEITTKILMELLKNGQLLVQLDYVEETETLNMVFESVGEQNG